MTSDSQFNAIRPYIGEEIPAAVERLSQAEEFLTLFSQMTRVDKSKIQEQLKGITSREQFQAQFFGPTIQRLIAGTTQGTFMRKQRCCLRAKSKFEKQAIAFKYRK